MSIRQWGCPLCGDFHRTVFHSYPSRTYRGPDGELCRLRVVTILCAKEREAGRPYTRRMLPEHLIPRSPLWSDRLVGLLEAGRDREKNFLDETCAALGCVDPRTARKHVRALGAAAQAKVAVIAGLDAEAPDRAQDLTIPPDLGHFALLAVFWERFLASRRSRSGTMAAETLRPLLWLGPGFQTWAVFNRSCIPIVVPPG